MWYGLVSEQILDRDFLSGLDLEHDVSEFSTVVYGQCCMPRYGLAVHGSRVEALNDQARYLDPLDPYLYSLEYRHDLMKVATVLGEVDQKDTYGGIGWWLASHEVVFHSHD